MGGGGRGKALVQHLDEEKPLQSQDGGKTSGRGVESGALFRRTQNIIEKNTGTREAEIVVGVVAWLQMKLQRSGKID